MGMFESHIEMVSRRERRRIMILSLLFGVSILILLFRIFTFQVLKGPYWRAIAEKQYKQRVKLTATRGIIYDRNREILAMDFPSYSFAIDPNCVNDVNSTASVLATILHGNKEQYIKILKRKDKKAFVRLCSDVTESQKNRMIDSKIPGLILMKEQKRVRPYHDLALPVLGIVNGERMGVGGIEQKMDRFLRGRDGWAIYQKDGLNRDFSSLDYPVDQPEDGYNVILTIDDVYQIIIEEELKRGVIDHRAKGGSAVLMDPFSGEVLAMASVSESEDREINSLIKNRAVQTPFEPGSVFKIVTIAAALEEKKFQPNSIIHCENGAYKFSDHIIHDHGKGYGWLTVRQILEYSSNIGVVKIGTRMGKKVLFKYARDFGFGNKTGISLPGESPGIMKPLYHWNDFMVAMVSFGQGISATTLQIACMISVVANGGLLLRPYIIKSITNESGEEIRSFSGQIIRRVISQQTAYKLRDILEGVVLEGSGKKAAVDGIRVAGKTGTAQKSIPGYKGYYPGAYVCSFAGFWPVEAPRFVLVIVLDEPRYLYWGSESAAPVFSRIVTRISGLPESQVPQIREKRRPDKMRFVFTDLVESAPKKQKRIKRSVEFDSPDRLPNLIGLSVRQALKKLAARGIEVTIQGGGVVVDQNPKPGMKIERGMVCHIVCKEPEWRSGSR